MQAALRSCERGLELWYQTTSIGWEHDTIFAVPTDPDKSGWYMASDDSPAGEKGFDWLRGKSTSPLDLIGSPVGEEVSFDGVVEDREAEYLLTTPAGELVLDNSVQDDEPVIPPGEDKPVPIKSIDVIILPSGKSRDMRWFAGANPRASGDIVVFWSKSVMKFHSGGSVTTLEQSSEVFRGEDAVALTAYIKEIGRQL